MSGLPPEHKRVQHALTPFALVEFLFPSVIDQQVFLTEIAFWQPDSYQVMQILALYLAL